MKTALLAGGGSYDSNGCFSIKHSFYDYTIAVDGGIHILRELRIKPDYFVGDMDSNNLFLEENGAMYLLDEDGNKTSDVIIEKLEPEKDLTDMEYALNRAVDLGATDIELIGAIGSRMDHSISNMNLMKKYSRVFDSISITDGMNYILPLVSGLELSNMISYTMSIVLSEDITNLSLKGFKYEVFDFDIRAESSRLNSNVIISNQAVINFSTGSGWVVLTKE